MIQIFYDNGIDIRKEAYGYGLLPTRPGEGFIFNLEKGVYQHEIIGDRDNGRINKVYDSEEAMVEDMTYTIRKYALYERRECNRKKTEESELNKKIFTVSHYCYIQITGYKGFSITKDRDSETWEETWRATQITLKGPGVEFCSSTWIGNTENAKVQEQIALNQLKENINIFTEIETRLLENGDILDTNFVYGYFQHAPNTQGVFKEQNHWFLYSTDEKNVCSITGPFIDNEVIYAVAKTLHKSKFFEDYRFGNDAMQIYIHSHYRSIEEAINATR